MHLFSLRIPKKRGLDFELKKNWDAWHLEVWHSHLKRAESDETCCAPWYRLSGTPVPFFVRLLAGKPKMKKTTHGLWEKRAPIAEAVYIYIYTYIYNIHICMIMIPMGINLPLFCLVQICGWNLIWKNSRRSPQKKNVRNSFQMVWP